MTPHAPDGSLDYDQDFRMTFDWCVAAVHSHFDLTPAQQTLPPETLQDLPLVPGQRVYDVSAQRGFTDEEIDTGSLPAGDYLVQVAGYNGSASTLPYSLRARVVSDRGGSRPAWRSPSRTTRPRPPCRRACRHVRAVT